MQQFPALSAPLGRWQLPIADPVVVQLTSAMLERGPPRIRRLLSVLRSDAPTALWAIAARNEVTDRPLRSIAQLANWLSEFLVERLADGDMSPQPLPPQPLWVDLATTAAATARLAEHFAELDEARPAVIAQSHLDGLLAAARQWLEATGPRVSLVDAGKGKSILPAWLGRRLQEIARARRAPRASGVSRSARYVARALAAGDDPQSLAAAPPAFSESLRDDLSRVRAAWEQSVAADATADPLPLMVVAHRCRRLEQLEDNFSEVLETAKLQSLRQLAYGASHEINNPLANISTRAQALMREEPDRQRRRKLATISAQAFRAHEMISDMMLFANPPTMNLQSWNVRETLTTVAEELADWARQQGTELALDQQADKLLVRADPSHLAVAIKAVVENALEALGGGGRVALSARRQSRRYRRPQVLIAVEDNGPGFADEARRHAFDPFYSGREAGRGLGFGLSKCWRVAELHGGGVDIDSEPGQGTRVTIRLPVADDPIPPAESDVASPSD